MTTPAEYRNGGEGFIKWVDENCRLHIYPKGSDVPVWVLAGELPPEYAPIWDGQKEIAREALKMKRNRFVHRLIVLCWMRGDGKSLTACLIQMWKFFNFPRQQIVLGANSKEQTKFVHYEIIRDIILNSPKLISIVGVKNVQEKEIRIKDSAGNIVSQIRAISSFSGIVSNITGYTFSEMFDMKNPKFFVQLDGSTRWVPNALGVIDSTVSDKGHVLFKLFQTYNSGEDPLLYFSHRCSPGAKEKDYWNPNMSQEEIDSFRGKFPPEEFERYFENTWSAGQKKQFTREMVESTRYLGANGKFNNHGEVMALVKRKIKVLETADEGEAKSIDYRDTSTQLEDIETALIPVDSVYTMGDQSTGSQMASNLDLAELGKMFKTGWAIMAGFDRSDPMKTDTNARTIFTLVAKGLPMSLENPLQDFDENFIPQYIYFLLHIKSLEKNTLEEMKGLLDEAHKEFDGLDKVTAERWGTWDLGTWCEDAEVPFEGVYPNYNKQRDAFSELYLLYRDGRFKTPTCNEVGSELPDILYEEALKFQHDVAKKKYGSPDKSLKSGVQDDAMYSLGWCIYGGRELGIDHLRVRQQNAFFGEMVQPTDNIGKY